MNRSAIALQTVGRAERGSHPLARGVVLATGFLYAFIASGDTSSITVSDSSATVTNANPVILNFQVTRGYDTSYDAYINFQTVDGSALASRDYTGANGTLTIPAGISSTSIPVTIAGSGGPQSTKTFTMQLSGAVGIGPAPNFASQQFFATGNDPRSVMAVDINGDGEPDLIASNFQSSTVSALINNTAPGATTASFATQQVFGAGQGPLGITAADINGDGRPDLIVVNATDNTVSVLLNTTAPGVPTASFTAQQTFPTGINPNSVAVADISGDGRPDLIVSNNNDNTVSVLLNTAAPGAATPSFATQQTFATGRFPYSLTAADINGDGRPDLIVANNNDNTISVLLNTTAPAATTPSFAAQKTFSTDNSPISVTTVDVDGDGNLDVVAATLANTVSVLLNNTLGGATTPVLVAQSSFAVGQQPYSVTATDLNGDGKPDLIVANAVGTVSVLRNISVPGTGVPTFATKAIFSTGNGPQSVTSADINNDGKPDLIVANSGAVSNGAPNPNTVSVLLNLTPVNPAFVTLAPQTTFPGVLGATQTVSVTTADFNGDGLPEIIATSADSRGGSAGGAGVYLNKTIPGAGTPSFEQTTRVYGRSYSATATDVNGDGKPDLIVANFDLNTVSVMLKVPPPGANPLSFGSPSSFVVGSLPFIVSAADINGDGRPDLIVTNVGDNTASVLLNTTAPGATTPSFTNQQTLATGVNPFSMAVADINGDGKVDLIVSNDDRTTKTVSVLINTTVPGAATASFGTRQSFATPDAPESVRAVDVNGDGRPDIETANTNFTVSVLFNTTVPGAAAASFASQQTASTGGSRSLAAADFNGDGKIDLIVSSQLSKTVSILKNDTAPYAATPSFSGLRDAGTGSFPTSIAAVDVNGDGRPDLVVANPEDNTLSVILNRAMSVSVNSAATGTIGYAAPRVGLSTSSLIFADQIISTTSQAQTITITNTGGFTLNVGTPAISGSSSSDFAITGNTCTIGLAANGSCDISVDFAPTAAGSRTATLNIPSNAPSSPDVVSLSGNGVAQVYRLQVSGDTDFGSQRVNSTGGAHRFIIQNTGNVSIMITGISAAGANSSDFSIVGGSDLCSNKTLAVNASCTVSYAFTPSASGNRNATEEVGTNHSGTAISLTLTGTGTQPGLQLSSGSLNFGDQVTGTTSSSQTITISNSGNADLILGTLTISGANSSSFVISGSTCGSAAIPPSGTCSISISFSPGEAGSQASTLNIPSDAPSNPDAVSLSGVGIQPSASGGGGGGGGLDLITLCSLLALRGVRRRRSVIGAGTVGTVRAVPPACGEGR